MYHRHKAARRGIGFGFILIIIVAVATLMWANGSRTPNLPQPPLKDLAATHGVQLGNFASLRRLNENPYSDILTSQYEFVTLDGEPNWTFNDGSLRPGPSSYDFKNIDKVMQFAQTHNLPVQAHHLVWGEEKWLPQWLKNGKYNKAQLLDLIHQHIKTVAGHYNGQIREWTVVNEAFSRSTHIYNLRDWWADHTGGQSYIDQSFIWARQTDPSAKLILNDFNNETQNDISDRMYAYVKAALKRKVPIDGIGMQMHLDGTRPPNKDDMISNMRRFAALGPQIYVTELDVNMSGVRGDQVYRDRVEAGIYYDVARACIESGVCHSFAQLGITDKSTWYNDMGLKNANPLMFDSKYRPKPAFYSFRKAWQES
jgi:endo-1,4-beta-xylanase